MKKTKIISTIGPAVNSEEMLMKLFETGVNVARINFSHGTHSQAVKQIVTIRNAASKVNKHIGIMLDTKGPEIRIGTFENGSYSYQKGDVIKITKTEKIGNQDGFSINCEELFDDIKTNDTILIDDGKINLTVLDVTSDVITARFNNPGTIKDHKGINVPGVKLSMKFISETDESDIIFGCRQGVDLIALSFVRRKQDIEDVRSLLAKHGRSDIEIIAKIENKEAIENFDEILEATDGIMVARGDLGVEIDAELVPIYQKKMIKKANAVGKPVITATHMLESMITSPRPTRAEVSDIANAILDGSDAIMLSGETAVGAYPIESVQYMVKIAEATEQIIDYRSLLQKSSESCDKTLNDAIGACVAECCLTLNISAVLAFTETGGTAKRISKYRPSVPIIACTDSPSTCRKLSYYWGVTPVIANYINDITLCDDIAITVANSIGFAKGSNIILTGGFGQDHGSTNTIRIIKTN